MGVRIGQVVGVFALSALLACGGGDPVTSVAISGDVITFDVDAAAVDCDETGFDSFAVAGPIADCSGELDDMFELSGNSLTVDPAFKPVVWEVTDAGSGSIPFTYGQEFEDATVAVEPAELESGGCYAYMLSFASSCGGQVESSYFTAP